MTGTLNVDGGATVSKIGSTHGEFYIDVKSSISGGWGRGMGLTINNSSLITRFGFYGEGQSFKYAYIGTSGNEYQKWNSTTSTISTDLVVNKNITGLNNEFSLISGGEHFQHRHWGGAGSYSYEVLLLLPIPATNNLAGTNTIDGTISGYTNGANQCFWVDVKISTIYNTTFRNIKSISSFLSNQYVLKKCKYNNVWYYCIEIPYRDNRIDGYYFRGVIRSNIAGGLSTITLPYRIKYKTKANGNNAEVINNSEINSSLSTTLTQGGITHVSSIGDTYYQNIKPHLSNSITSGTTDLRWRCVYSYNLDISSTSTFAGKATFNGGLSGTLTGSLSGNATTATTLQTSRTIWGQSFNGAGNVSGSLTGVASITASGNITAAGAITAKSSSDFRLKENYDGLIDYRERLLKLGRVYDYNYNKKALDLYQDRIDNKRHTGLVYQNAVKAGITNFCHEKDEYGYGSLNYLSPDLIATIIGSVQANILSIRLVESEQERMRKELEHAKSEINRLKGLVASLQN